ncbi:MAG: tyrosine-type recombinase/integrase [Azospirillaceae bacterium]
MSSKRLTVTQIDALPKPAARIEIPDGGASGLYLIVQPTGTKSWAFRYRLNGTHRRVNFGRYPRIGLSDARMKALELTRELEKGRDPAPKRGTVREAVEDFIAKHAKKRNRSWPAVERALNRSLVARYGDQPIGDLTRGKVLAILDDLVAADKPTMANRMLAYIRRFGRWCVEREMLDDNPAAGIGAQAEETSRERVLDDDELLAVWRATLDEPGWTGALVRTLILTGQRLNEVAGMTWEEVDIEGATWTIPGARAKNKSTHTIPLPPAVIDELLALDFHGDQRAGPVFPGRDPDKAIGNFRRLKARLDKASGVTDWTFHDLRRTAASGMARLQTAPHVVEKILNHKSGTIKGVAAVYNRFDYMPQMKHALGLWARHVLSLGRKRLGKVVNLEARA